MDRSPDLESSLFEAWNEKKLRRQQQTAAVAVAAAATAVVVAATAESCTVRGNDIEFSQFCVNIRSAVC